MIRCLAVDDEPLALGQLKNYIGKVPFLQLAGACQSALAATKMLADTPVDAIFADINMPDLNGLDFIRSLQDPPLVVFTTAYSEYAIDGYKVNAVDYLLKPFGLDEFQRAANKVLKQYKLMHPGTENAAVGEDNVLFLKSDYKMVRIDIDDILYVEGMSEYLKIFLDGAAKPVIVLLSMKKLEARLPQSKFMRVHRSYIVNLSKIKEIQRGRIVIDKSTYIPIGDLYKDAMNTYLSDKSLEK